MSRIVLWMRDPMDITRGVEKTPISLAEEREIDNVQDFVYVRCNIPGPGTDRGLFEEQIDGCLCGACDEGVCSCLQRYGQAYDEHKLLILEDGHLSTHRPIIECNRSCKCEHDCINRVVQLGVQVRLQVFRTKRKGFGLRVLDKIQKNTFICEYAGEVLTKETAKVRTKILSENPNSSNYILVLNEHLASGKTLTTYIDPMYVGNVGRFINHSCEPNLFMAPVRINHNIPSLALFALRDIEPEEELSFNYSGVVHASSNGMVRKFSQNSFDSIPIISGNVDNVSEEEKSKDPARKVCHCGSANCQGYLPYDESLYAEEEEQNEKGV